MRRHAVDVTAVEVAISWAPGALTTSVHDDGRSTPGCIIRRTENQKRSQRHRHRPRLLSGEFFTGYRWLACAGLASRLEVGFVRPSGLSPAAVRTSTVKDGRILAEVNRPATRWISLSTTAAPTSASNL